MLSIVQALEEFYRGRRVLVTGHTGFKGAWLVLWLRKLGANITGIALAPDSDLGLFSSARVADIVESHELDIRDRELLSRVVREAAPEVVFHFAAQALVGISYDDPIGTFATNVMGTLHVLEAVHSARSVRSMVIATTDKCYENVEQIWGYRETDRLGGRDPYSASKACAELAGASYVKSFLDGKPPFVATARAGNVVGGGDWGKFRLVPDCIRALRHERPIEIRNPRATRPWQFVLDPLAGYLMLARRLATDGASFTGAWNFGPPADDQHDVESTARLVLKSWGGGWLEVAATNRFHESHSLSLDPTKTRRHLGWRTVADFETAVRLTTEWYRHQHGTSDGGMRDFSESQIAMFEQRLSGTLSDVM
ncbi:CDP-glucose 4,6-dehydratase [Myxococcota bacterium]